MNRKEEYIADLEEKECWTFEKIKKLVYEDKMWEFIGERLGKKYLIIYRDDEDEMDICFEDTYTYLFTVHDDEEREIEFFNDLRFKVVKE